MFKNVAVLQIVNVTPIRNQLFFEFIIVHPNGIPAIVPEDLFNRVQERMAATKKAPLCSLPPFDCRYKSRDCNYCFDNKICNFKGGRLLILLLTVQDYFIFKASYIQRNSFSVSDIFFELSFTSICISGVKSNSLSPW